MACIKMTSTGSVDDFMITEINYFVNLVDSDSWIRSQMDFKNKSCRKHC